MADGKLYFAYGSNINLEQMAYRCPDASVVGPVTLEGWELLFRRGGFATIAPKVSTPFKNVIFRRNRMSFFAGQHTGVYSLNYRPTCRLEARQVLIYQCILDLTGENGKYNYSKAAHLYPPLSYSPCSAKNYKIASALTQGGRTGDRPAVEHHAVV